MPALTPSQRRDLRAAAHPLHPVVAIGHHGLTPAVLHEIDVALLAHELIKVRVFDDDRAARESLMARVCAEMRCAPVQHIGKLLVLWRVNPEKGSRASKSAGAPRKARMPKPSGTDDPRKAKKKARTRDVRKEKAKAGAFDERAARPAARTRNDDRPPRARGAPNARRRRSAGVAEVEAPASPPPASPPRGDQARRRRRAVKT